MRIQKRTMFALVAASVLLSGFCKLDGFAENLNEHPEFETINILTEPGQGGPESIAEDTNSWLPELKEGNYAKWIDRVELPEYATDFYEMLEEAVDNDGIDDFLIDPSSGNLVEEFEEVQADGTISTGRGVAVVQTKGSGRNWNEAMAELTDDFYEKFYHVRTAYEAFDRDFADVFWLNSSNYIAISQYEYSQDVDPKTNQTIFVCTANVYFGVESELYQWNIWYDKYNEPTVIRSMIAEIDAQAERIVSAVSDQEPAEQMKYFNDWIIKNNEYNHLIGYGQIDVQSAVMLMPDTFECTGALRGGVGNDGPVCESYARSFKVLCDKAGIPCVLVDGFALNGVSAIGENHMWNYVYVDGNWYAVDTTWNDPLGGAAGAVSGYENESYLMIGEDTVTYVGNTQMRFIESHPVRNRLYEDGISFINGPVLQKNAYTATMKSLKVSATAEQVEADYSESIFITASAEKVEGAAGEVNYIWYEVDENGVETLIAGENDPVLEIPAGKTGGTYIYRVKASLGNNTKQKDIQIKINAFVEDIFADIEETAWYLSYVQYVYEKDIMTGNKDTGLFNPNDNLLRQQFVMLLWNMEGKPIVEDNTAFEVLVDADETQYYADALRWAYSEGIMTGVNGKYFKGSEPLKRQQLAKMLYEYAEKRGYDVSADADYSDMEHADQVSDYAVKYMGWAVGTGMITGKGGTDLAPMDTATRAAVAKIVKVFCDTYTE